MRYFDETTLFRVRTSHHVQGSPAPPRGHAAGLIMRIEAQAREEIVPSCRAPVDDQAAKDYATMVVRATFELTGVTRYVFACESKGVGIVRIGKTVGCGTGVVPRIRSEDTNS